MAETKSTMLALGSTAPDFNLPDTEGKNVRLSAYSDKAGYLVVFMCNHCPYVKMIKEEMSRHTAQFIRKGIAVFGICANDADTHPEDGPEKMKADADKFGYQFPYLYDETQETAKAYHAACTPDFFLFNSEKKLVYRGQFDGARPGNGRPVTGEDLCAAVEATLNNRPASEIQKPSLGCNIKWKPGNEPSYF